MFLEGNAEPEPTSDVTCEVMASGFGAGQEGNKESFLQAEVRILSQALKIKKSIMCLYFFVFFFTLKTMSGTKNIEVFSFLPLFFV